MNKIYRQNVFDVVILSTPDYNYSTVHACVSR